MYKEAAEFPVQRFPSYALCALAYARWWRFSDPAPAANTIPTSTGSTTPTPGACVDQYQRTVKGRGCQPSESWSGKAREAQCPTFPLLPLISSLLSLTLLDFFGKKVSRHEKAKRKEFPQVANSWSRTVVPCDVCDRVRRVTGSADQSPICLLTSHLSPR